ncbi:Sulfate transport system permease protein CysW [uncultured Roseburia sp.]|uniref:2-aminoethylphosphonate ABC transporter permease subunit n=1 Tax=Brotonthovivens ammoniilytica TaxID=2981725 RepID=A0ABT2TGY2_9FIRM|nr:putative 2-aminoethylphosphonate ABC transporter permease subunit [Brotonthovivens ammoniilytica]MCU6761415.1 putative 2-aminoethylphosphonate ABC transporter permease subunit [Brotonthovivens ammoniilytica]SCI27781.1 Sulfate transport system permease protein CysW [uncultured Roseburia sp.]
MKNKLLKLKSYTMQDFMKLILILCILFSFCVFLLGPLCILFVKAFQNKDGDFTGFAQFAQYLSSPNMVASLGNTLFIAVTSTVISVALAFCMAYVLTRRKIPFRGFFRFLSMLPMFAPTMLFGMSLIYLFGNKGLITQLGLRLPIYGRLGIVIAESIYCFPVALMILMVAFSAADNRLYEAAEAMGTSPFRKLMTITIPGIKYGLINAVFVCFTYSFTDFGAPSIVGGNYNVLATDIYKQVIGQQNFNMGAVVGIIMMIPTVISFVVDRLTSSRQASAITARSVPYQIKPAKGADRAGLIFCIVISALLIGFFAVSFYGAVVTSWPYNMKLTWSHFDFSQIDAGNGLRSLLQSLKVSALTAVCGTIAAFLTAYLIEKLNVFPKLRKVLYFFSITPNAVPGTVIGLSFILFFNPRWFQIPGTALAVENGFNFLYGTTAILVIVNIIHYFSVPFVTASTALKRLDKEFEIVSDSLKVPLIRTFFRITVPISAGAVWEMFIYYFMNGMITVSAVIFLYTPLTKIASVVILNVQGAGDDAEAAALCMVIFGINIIVRLVYELVNKKIRKKTEKWMHR